MTGCIRGNSENFAQRSKVLTNRPYSSFAPLREYLNTHDFSLELAGERAAPGCFQVRHFRCYCFDVINTDYQTMSTNAAEDGEWRVVAFRNLAHGTGVRRVEADDDS